MSDRARGGGTEAVRMFAQWLFDHGATAVRGGTDQGNAAMRRVFERLGFVPVSRQRTYGMDEVLYRVTAEQWRMGGEESARPVRQPAMGTDRADS